MLSDETLFKTTRDWYQRLKAASRTLTKLKTSLDLQLLLIGQSAPSGHSEGSTHSPATLSSVVEVNGGAIASIIAACGILSLGPCTSDELWDDTTIGLQKYVSSQAPLYIFLRLSSDFLLVEVPSRPSEIFFGT